MPSQLANMLVEGLRSNHERIEPRPPNLEVERAWKEYAQAFESMQAALNRLSGYSLSSYDDVEMVLQVKKEKAASDAALMHYWEVYDADQREAFGNG